MSLVTPNVSEVTLLQYILNMLAPNNPVLHLYTNSVVLGNSTVLGNLTECTTPGYTPITLPSAGWTTVINSGIVTGVYSQQTFNLNTGVSVYGYYVTNSSNNLLWAEQFSGAPFTLPAGGGEIQITSQVTLGSC